MLHKRTIAALLPPVFAFITVFITHETVAFFLLAGLGLIVAEFLLVARIVKESKSSDWLKVALPFMLIVVGSIGVSLATTLTREKIQILIDPSYAPTCSISPIVACSPIIGSDQASAFGFPNPLLGIFGFGALLIAGFSLLAGGVFKSWWWRSLWVGASLGLGFCFWLIYSSLYEIGALCIYCMVAWVITFFVWNYITLYCMQNKYIRSNNKLLNIYQKNHAAVLFLMYAIVIALIYFQFDYYWNTLI